MLRDCAETVVSTPEACSLQLLWRALGRCKED